MGDRGRGRGSNKSFSREQLSSLGVNNTGEALPEPVTQPPPLFPLLARKPVKQTISEETKYLLMLKQNFRHHLRLNAPDEPPELPRNVDKDSNITKLLAQLPKRQHNFNWAYFPAELRPKLVAAKSKAAKCEVKKVRDEKNIQERLAKLEELEKMPPVVVKEEVEDDPDADYDENLMEDVEDEEMDDGTDYARNYFDNGEAYEDEDDNLDDGPSY